MEEHITLCIKGDLLGLQQYLELHPDINISAKNEMAFRFTCSNGHLDVCQWLLHIKPDIVINEYTFHCACVGGHLAVCQWLLQISKERGQDINISINSEQIFRYVCQNGELAVAQWLLQIKPDINISAIDHHAFRDACKNGHLPVAQWLQSLKPNLYVIIYGNYGGKIFYKSYYIRNKEEENWEKRKYLVYIASDCKEDNLLYRLPCDIAKMVIGYV